MTLRITTISSCNRVLRSLPSVNHITRHLQVCSGFSSFLFIHTNYRFFNCFFGEVSSGDKINKIHKDISSFNSRGIAKSVISRCSHLWNKKREKFAYTSLQDLLSKISNISPKTTRKFLRVSELKPQDVLQILQGFEFDFRKNAIEASAITCLWEIFKWAKNQSKNFRHLPQSFEIMASMLVRVELFREVESLLSTMQAQGISPVDKKVFSDVIEGYAATHEIEMGISVYDRMRDHGLVPSLSCYRILIQLLVRKHETQLALRVYMDMLEQVFKLSDVESVHFENIIKLLCKDGRVQDARKFLKKAMALGLIPADSVLSEISTGYCEKKDFDDILSFYIECKRAPDVLIGNKIMFSLCSNFSTERADLFLRDLEQLGYVPDVRTFAILICWSCHEGKLKNAFVYVAKLLSRKLKPDIYSYNALIGGVFNVGMWGHAQDIYEEAIDNGRAPTLSTFKVLLAGYCKARQFDKVKEIVDDMVKHSFIQLALLEDPLSKAFLLLGFSPFAVKVKRDNDVGFSKTEFFDGVGNGLFLETDMDEYEKKLTSILRNSMIPDFNSLLVEECDRGNLKSAYMMINDMSFWGQEPSLTAFSVLIRAHCSSRSNFKVISSLFDKYQKLASQLDGKILNLLVQALNKKEFMHKQRIIFDEMLKRNVPIENESYTALVIGLFKEKSYRGFHYYWEIARKDDWVPKLEYFHVILDYLCRQEMIEKALELFESLLVSYNHLKFEICNVLFEHLCDTGFTGIAHVCVEELNRLGFFFDYMAYAYVHLIRGFFKEKKFPEANSIFHLMVAKSMTIPYEVSLLLIPWLCSTGRFEKAIALKEIVLRSQPSDSFSIYTALMNGFCKQGKVLEASHLFFEILSKGLIPDSEIYEKLIQAHSRVNNLRRVNELFGVVIRRKLNVSIPSYRYITRLMCMEGRFLQALSVKDFMLKENSSSKVIIYNILIFSLFQTGNILLVNTLLKELEQHGLILDEITYNFLIIGYCRWQDMTSSRQCLNTLITKDLTPTNRSLRELISCMCDHGMIHEALDLSRIMELKGWVHGSSVQNRIVEGLLSQNKLKEAEEFLDRMVEKGLVPDSITYDNLIKRFCSYGRLKRAVDLLDLMLKRGNIPNAATYDFIIHSFCKCKKLHQAMDFFTEMMVKKLKPRIKTWDLIVRNLCEEGRTEDAEKLFIYMTGMALTPTREMYCLVIDRLRSDNKFEKASEVLQAMQRNGYTPDFETHWSLISNLSNFSDKESSNRSSGFLSRLLSESGFAQAKESKSKIG